MIACPFDNRRQYVGESRERRRENQRVRPRLIELGRPQACAAEEDGRMKQRKASEHMSRHHIKLCEEKRGDRRPGRPSTCCLRW
jgi:hypothetical protein